MCRALLNDRTKLDTLKDSEYGCFRFFWCERWSKVHAMQEHEQDLERFMPLVCNTICPLCCIALVKDEGCDQCE
jgi:hypothetical protein